MYQPVPVHHYETPLYEIDTSGTLTLYRVSRTKYADMSGMGSARFPGRWNNQGQRALYTSLEVGTAALEVLSYLDRNTPPPERYSLMTITLRAGSCSKATRNEWIPSSAALVLHRSVKEGIDYKGRSESTMTRLTPVTLALVTPSYLVPAYNVVLFPDHPEFDSLVSLVSVQPFAFHPYLFGQRSAMSAFAKQ